MARKPMFNHPFAFWKTICEEIQNGLIENGFEKLIQAASQKSDLGKIFFSLCLLCNYLQQFSIFCVINWTKGLNNTI